MNVEPFKNATKLELCTKLPDLRRDLHVFVSYVRERELKRAHRDNSLPKTDARRLAKLMSDPQADNEILDDGRSQWVDYVDEVALNLGFVKYDTSGSYAGYNSYARSYQDNFIEVNAKAYDEYLKKTLAQQESQLLESLLKQRTGSKSEFFVRPVLCRLNCFSPAGSAIGVVPTLDFPKARRLLLKLLAELPPGEWLSTASLIAFVKQHHPYFLIPENPQFKHEWDKKKGRYGNFSEGDPFKGNPVEIMPSDPDGFERVEGRYIERFLEGLPNVAPPQSKTYFADSCLWGQAKNGVFSGKNCKNDHRS